MTASNGNVLIVDDLPDRAKKLASFLSSSGFHVQLVTDVSNTTYSLGWDSDVDVVLCELDLKDFSWVTARHALREMDVQVPSIMFCDVADPARMMTALRLGASDFFLRPLEDKAALIRSIARCVRQRSLRRELQESRNRLEAANTELRGTIKMLEQDQQAGRQVQMRMLPVTPMLLNDYVFSHTVIPSLYLSGDFLYGRCLGAWQLVGFRDRAVEKPVCAQKIRLLPPSRQNYFGSRGDVAACE
jgi:sigma-B regulation protein RsbU (phosphoserine phosphatase)